MDLMQRHIRRQREHLRHYEMQLGYLSPAGKIRERKTRCLQLEERLQERMEWILNRKKHLLALYIEKMKGLSPLEKLNSGFSYVENQKGENIRSVKQVSRGDNLHIRLKDGTIVAEVIGKEEIWQNHLKRI